MYKSMNLLRILFVVGVAIALLVFEGSNAKASVADRPFLANKPADVARNAVAPSDSIQKRLCSGRGADQGGL